MMTPIVFFARLAALVPPPRHPLVLIGWWMGSFWRRRLASNGRSFCGGLTQ
ncbi:hypothetical protein [Sorangium sp. So ce375]|uniref:hypothetical protein n=1 Tax=Sorangium sp. So ce375 TaxID=3133306 RepID=UPI003F5BE5B0